jgi:hypothetical protein
MLAEISLLGGFMIYFLFGMSLSANFAALLSHTVTSH